ncbi:hypothetical protein ACFORO_12370 [Amycolatopsis halotolerans]|uniref:Uncharacterized protein n=1 Tax=Amycolatopsis halotolerans TaxID=330083 RepID=A0ABV7QGF7_9PSEU
MTQSQGVAVVLGVVFLTVAIAEARPIAEFVLACVVDAVMGRKARKRAAKEADRG